MDGAILGHVLGASCGSSIKNSLSLPSRLEYNGQVILMGLAAKALLNCDEDTDDDDSVRNAFAKELREHGKECADAGGFDDKFSEWLRSGCEKPYKNTSPAIGIVGIPAAWLCRIAPKSVCWAMGLASALSTDYDALEAAALVAEAVAFGRYHLSDGMVKLKDGTGYSIEDYIETCKEMVVEENNSIKAVYAAVDSFLAYETYEDIVEHAADNAEKSGFVKEAVCYAGAMAESMYEVPAEFVGKALEVMPDNIKGIAKKVAQKKNLC